MAIFQQNFFGSQMSPQQQLLLAKQASEKHKAGESEYMTYSRLLSAKSDPYTFKNGGLLQQN